MREFTPCLVNEAGQGMVEYALIIAFVAIVTIAVLQAFGISVNDLILSAQIP